MTLHNGLAHRITGGTQHADTTPRRRAHALTPQSSVQVRLAPLKPLDCVFRNPRVFSCADGETRDLSSQQRTVTTVVTTTPPQSPRSPTRHPPKARHAHWPGQTLKLAFVSPPLQRLSRRFITTFRISKRTGRKQQTWPLRRRLSTSRSLRANVPVANA